jgi:hypothetical protein
MRLQVAQGRIGEGREWFVIAGLHPAVERDAESEHARLRPVPLHNSALAL